MFQTWDRDHFTVIESGEHEMVNLADPLPPLRFSSKSLSPYRNSGLEERSV